MAGRGELLSCCSGPGTADIDFVLFRECLILAENTFRPPWYCKNINSEPMCNVFDQFNAKPQGSSPAA